MQGQGLEVWGQGKGQGHVNWSWRILKENANTSIMCVGNVCSCLLIVWADIVVSGQKHYFKASSDNEQENWIERLQDASRITVSFTYLWQWQHWLQVMKRVEHIFTVFSQFQVGLLDWALISSGLALSPPSTSVSLDFWCYFCLFKITPTSL